MTPTESARSILDRRLALGEISIDEYQQMLRAMTAHDGSAPSPHRESIDAVASAKSKEDARAAPLASVDDLSVFSDSIVVRGESIPFASIARVYGGADQFTYNFIPMTKSSSLYIWTVDDREFAYTEDRTYLGNSRHKQIRATCGVLRQLTLQHRIGNLASRLRQHGRLVLGFCHDDDAKPVTLTSNGRLEADGLSVDLKAAKSHGAFGTGTLAKSISGLSSESRPEEIVASLHPVGWRNFHQASIVFTPLHEDSDVVTILLEWLAEPGNSLA
jgi:hypothetical protein